MCIRDRIITADLKVQALIDEHYVERVVQELPADFTRDGENYKLEVTLSLIHIYIYQRGCYAE